MDSGVSRISAGPSYLSIIPEGALQESPEVTELKALIEKLKKENPSDYLSNPQALADKYNVQENRDLLKKFNLMKIEKVLQATTIPQNKKPLIKSTLQEVYQFSFYFSVDENVINEDIEVIDLAIYFRENLGDLRLMLEDRQTEDGNKTAPLIALKVEKLKQNFREIQKIEVEKRAPKLKELLKDGTFTFFSPLEGFLDERVKSRLFDLDNAQPHLTLNSNIGSFEKIMPYMRELFKLRNQIQRTLHQCNQFHVLRELTQTWSKLQ